MSEKGLYDLELCDFNELISNIKVSLRNKNLEYEKLQNELEKIMDNYPNLQMIMEADEDLEEQEIFFMGGKEAYFYFKNIGILKE